MKIGAGVVLWVVIAIVFFRWFNTEELGTFVAADLARPRP